MIVRISQGGCFKGAHAYHLHDRDASTRERVAWTHTENMLTQDPDKAWKVMAYTVRVQDRLKEASGVARTGRKLEKPVFQYSLSWHPTERPDQEHMLQTAKDSLKALGLTEHEVLIVAHRDTLHPHCHVIVNRVHPMTGLAGDIRNSKRKLSAFAHRYEMEHGRILCPAREQNERRRQKGEPTMRNDPNISLAWDTTTTGTGFIEALRREGYELAHGRKRLVVVDPYGKSVNPTRHLDGVRAKDLRNRLRDVNLSELPDAGELGRQIEARRQKQKTVNVRCAKQEALWLNRLQDRHHAERAALHHEHHDGIEHERTRLVEYYQVPEQEARLKLLEERMQQPGWWHKVTGGHRKDQKVLNELRSNLENAKWRIQEKLDHLEATRDRAMAELAQRQSDEKRQLIQNLDREPSSTRSRTRSIEPHQQPRHHHEPRRGMSI